MGHCEAECGSTGQSLGVSFLRAPSLCGFKGKPAGKPKLSFGWEAGGFLKAHTQVVIRVRFSFRHSWLRSLDGSYASHLPGNPSILPKGQCKVKRVDRSRGPKARQRGAQPGVLLPLLLEVCRQDASSLWAVFVGPYLFSAFCCVSRILSFVVSYIAFWALNRQDQNGS